MGALSTDAFSFWRLRYEQSGIATIPLPSGKKAPPLVNHWQLTLPGDQWRAANERAGGHFRGNLAALTGGGLGIIDCDAPETETAVTAFLASMGLSVPTVRTPSGGAHLYARVVDVPATFCVSRLDAGPGELRCHNAYCVAPPSMVDGARYRWETGSPESVLGLRPIAWRDLQTLIGKAPTITTPTELLDAPPVLLCRRELGPDTVYLLRRLQNAPKARPDLFLQDARHTYESRSEAEAAVVAHLILLGRTFPEVVAEFERWQPGHYWERGKRRYRYLWHTWQSVLNFLAASPERLDIARRYEQARIRPWPGRSGLLDQAVYLGVLSKCWQFGALEVRASVRELAELAAASLDGVSRALDRLTRAGLLRRVEGWAPGRGTTWRVIGGAANSYSNHTVASQGRTLEGDGNAGRAAPLQHREGVDAAEVWGYGAMGRSAGAVWHHLTEDPHGARDLAALTGKHRRTVERALSRLASMGMAERTEGGWVRGSTTLQEAAETLNAPQRGRRRRAEHERQRRLWGEIRKRAAAKGGDDGE